MPGLIMLCLCFDELPVEVFSLQMYLLTTQPGTDYRYRFLCKLHFCQLEASSGIWRLLDSHRYPLISLFQTVKLFGDIGGVPVFNRWCAAVPSGCRECTLVFHSQKCINPKAFPGSGQFSALLQAEALSSNTFRPAPSHEGLSCLTHI